MRNDILQFEGIMLHRLPFVVQQRLPSEVWEQTIQAESFMMDEMLSTMLIQLRAYIYAEKLAEKKITIRTSGDAIFKFPSSPWQHFKMKHQYSWWIRWFVQRWAIRYEYDTQTVERSKKIKIQQFASFPESPIRTPEKFRGPMVVRTEFMDEC